MSEYCKTCKELADELAESRSQVARLLSENARLAAELAEVLDACKYGKGIATPEHTWKQWCDELISENRILEAKNADLRERMHIIFDLVRKD